MPKEERVEAVEPSESEAGATDPEGRTNSPDPSPEDEAPVAASPESELLKELQQLRERVAHQEGQISALSEKAKAPAEPAQKVFTREELETQVDLGNMTEVERDKILEAQSKATIKAELRAMCKEEA